MDTLELKLADAVRLVVPASLDSITTYVLLEQEAWFEKEAAFLRHWLRPGMTAIDIGANLGVYSLPMARSVGPTGRVFAYEPASEPRALLERSRELNGARNLEIFARALSDGEREGYLVFGGSSELNALGQSGRGEPVRITSFDAEDNSRGWTAPDFVKIDAEGEEERILAGGRNFFARHSPLIMCEIKAGDTVNERLRAAFPGIGYRLFRALSGAPVLVALESVEALDGYELNVFAAKPDRANCLRERGFLVDPVPDWEPRERDMRQALELLRSQAFAPAFAALLDDAVAVDVAYRQSLAGYAVWRMADQPQATRCAALAFAVRVLRALCARAPNAARLATFARVSSEWGRRSESVAALQTLLRILQGGPPQLAEPFWPPCPRFDTVPPTPQQAPLWFAAATAEQFERSAAFSSCFSGSSPVIGWLCSQPFVCAEMERRRTLLSVRSGRQGEVASRLHAELPDHLNAELWRAGRVPGTTVSR